jgi:hypothetical protein
VATGFNCELIFKTKGLGPPLLKVPRQHLAGVTSFAILVQNPTSKHCFSRAHAMEGITYVTLTNFTQRDHPKLSASPLPLFHVHYTCCPSESPHTNCRVLRDMLFDRLNKLVQPTPCLPRTQSCPPLH